VDLEAIRSKPARFVIGLMSGSSCDGVDAALVRIKGTGAGLRLKFVSHLTVPYSQNLRNRLLNTHIPAQDVCLLNFEIGERLAEAALTLLRSATADGHTVDFIASHGHTLAHVPPRGAEAACGTLQIGESAVIAERTRLPVVSDFRPRDMAAGGQGAPLVPYADWVLFSPMKHPVACLNIGGIANFTLVTQEFSDVFAFDTGPGNMVIDGTVRLLTRGMQQMDEDGILAARGRVVQEFLDYLLSHPFLARKPPKSTGREEFGVDVYLRDALASRKDQSFEDMVTTVTTAVANSITNAFDEFIKPRCEVEQIIVSGGGAYNRTLLGFIRNALPGIMVRTSDQYGLPSKAREAIAFAILGNETMCGTPANVPQATGANRPVLLGKITPDR